MLSRILRAFGRTASPCCQGDVETNIDKDISCLRQDDDEEKETSGEDRKEKERSSGNRTKGNQRWMKLRTTVQLSGAISSTIQKSKPPLKREDSFLKRFSTRQIPELEETIDTGEEAGLSSSSASGGISSLGWKKHRRKRKHSQQIYTVVNPDGNFYFYWLLVVSICVLYNLWTLIVRQAFPELQENVHTFWISCDLVTDVVFLLDVGVQLRTGYLEQGLMVYDAKKLAGHYVKSRSFLLDLAALFPLEIAQINTGVKPILRFPRFLKVYRVYSYYYIVESRTVYPNVWRVVNLIHILLILAHWFGCFYFLLSEAEGFQGDWVYPYRPGEYATLTRKYLGSLYWSTLTLTTIGDLPTPETNTEYIFTIVSYLIGVFIFATIVGQVGNVITNRNANRLEFERLLDGAKTYMRHHKVPGGMKRRVLRWYDYSWSRGRIQGGGDINTALGLLPDKLKTELALHVNLSVLKKVTIFQECQPEFLHDLVLKMKAYIFTPGDMICRKGEVAREMFIIADGILEVMSETGRVLTTMKAGDFFGEIGILNLDGLNKRTADVRSVGYSELFSLSREDVLTAMKDYPEAQEILQTLGRKRLMEARNLNRAWKMSAQQRRERNAAQQPKVEPEVDLNKSIVDKLRGDVKELRNVFKKSTRSNRTKSDCLELETTKYEERETTASLSKAQTSRSSCAYNGDTSHDEDSQASQKIGAGLPLMQRLKLLKEKQELEKKMSNESASSAPTNSDRREIDPALPLLQRILLLKQKDEKKSGVVQSTANMAAEVLASTVRTQLKSPTQLTLKSKMRGEEDGQSKFPEKKSSSAEFHKKIFMKKGRNVSLDLDQRAGTDIVSEKEPSKKHIERRNNVECDNESWILIKKAVLVPNNSLDSHDKKATEPKRSEPSNILKEKMLSAIHSATTSSEEVLLDKKKDEVDEIEEDLGGAYALHEDENEPKRHIECEGDSALMSRSDGEMRHKRSSPIKSSPLKVYRKQKTYNSIDDLSPEYSGLPFVKKLKILNERQKLAELEKDLPKTPEKDEDKIESLGERLRLILNDDERHPKDAERDTLTIRNGTVIYRLNGKGEITECKEDESDQHVTLDISNALEGMEGPVLSPESNETLERRQLKSILKKLSLVTTVQGSPDRRGDSSDGAKTTTDIRKLLRAPTVEGYAARHSKFTKSVTLNHNTTEQDVNSMENVSFTDSFSMVDESGLNAHSSWDNSTGKTRYSTWTDSSRSFDDSQLTEISTFENGLPVLNQSDTAFLFNKATIETIGKIQEAIEESEELDGFQHVEIKEHEIPANDNGKDVPYSSAADINCIPRELLTNLLSEIRKAIDDHMVTIEYKYICKNVKLEYECQRRDEMIMQLQHKIEELEREIAVGTTIPEEDEDEIDENNEENDEDDYDKCSYDFDADHITCLDSDIEELDENEDSDHAPSREDSTILTIDHDEDYSSDESEDSENEVFYTNNSTHNDWEIHLLAEELERREEASKRRAVSFDFSQLRPKSPFEEKFFEAHNAARRRARWSMTGECSMARDLTRRSSSSNNVQSKTKSKFDKRRTRHSYNGSYTRYPSTRIKKPASFTGGFS